MGLARALARRVSARRRPFAQPSDQADNLLSGRPDRLFVHQPLAMARAVIVALLTVTASLAAWCALSRAGRPG